MSFFVTFEGIDGCGKTSTIRAVEQKLIEQNFSVYASREPGGSILRNKIRDIIVTAQHLEPLTQLYLFLADRVEHVRQLTFASQNNDILMSDRYADSTVAYQAFGNDLNIWEMFKDLRTTLTMNLVPNLTFYLKIDIQKAKERMKNRGEKLSFFEKQGEEFYKRVIDGYEYMAQSNFSRIITIDVNEKSLDEVVNECFSTIMNKIPPKTV